MLYLLLKGKNSGFYLCSNCVRRSMNEVTKILRM